MLIRYESYQIPVAGRLAADTESLAVCENCFQVGPLLHNPTAVRPIEAPLGSTVDMPPDEVLEAIRSNADSRLTRNDALAYIASMGRRSARRQFAGALRHKALQCFADCVQAAQNSDRWVVDLLDSWYKLEQRGAASQWLSKQT